MGWKMATALQQVGQAIVSQPIVIGALSVLTRSNHPGTDSRLMKRAAVLAGR